MDEGVSNSFINPCCGIWIHAVVFASIDVLMRGVVFFLLLTHRAMPTAFFLMKTEPQERFPFTFMGILLNRNWNTL